MVEVSQIESTDILTARTDDFLLGAWRVSPSLNKISLRSGKLVRHLEPRLTKLLCYLAAKESSVISRDELVKELWPKVIVNENSLARAVSELRKQLFVENDSSSAYIETIPKRGYRLLVIVEEQSSLSLLAANNATFLPFVKQRQLSVAALCLSLVAGFWISQDVSNSEAPVFEEPILLADEIVESKTYFGGEVSLSTSESDALATETIEAPIVNEDKTHFAYIQYDHTGSTIFLGSIEEMNEPAPIYNSNDKLFNLAWSPLSNSLLFAKQGNLTTAALFSNSASDAELYAINTNNFEVSKLIEQAPKSDFIESSNSLNLT